MTYTFMIFPADHNVFALFNAKMAIVTHGILFNERCRKRHCRPMGHYLLFCCCTSNENSRAKVTDSLNKSGARQARAAHLARNPSTPSISAQETRHPHEMNAGLKSLCDLRSHVVLHTWFNATHAKTLPREDAREGLQVGLSRMFRA